MKKITLSMLLMFIGLVTYGQINIYETFDNGIPGDWDSTFAATSTEACSGQSIRDNLYSYSNTGNLTTSNIVGQSNATDLNISFDYKVVDWYAATNPTAAGWGSFVVEYSTDGGTTWIPVATVDDSNHVVSAGCATMSYTVAGADLPSGSDFMLQFSITWASGDYYFYFDNVVAQQEAQGPPMCDSELVSPSNGSTDAPVEGDISWTPASGIPTGYYLTVGTTPGGNDILDNEDVGNVTSYSLGMLEYSTQYYVTITAYNGFGTTTEVCEEQTFTTVAPPPAGTDCVNPIEVTTPLPYVTTDDTSNYGDDYSGSAGADCSSTSGYLNGDDVVYAYTPDTDTSIDIELSNLSGNYAGLFVYTSCADIGTQCVNGVTNSYSTDDMLIDNMLVTAGTTYYIVISTWASPQSVGYTLTITENTCVDAVVSYDVVGDCENGEQFLVEVDLSDMGSATSITISDNQSSAPQTVTSTGVYTFGPYANSTPVEITVVNDDDANCTIVSEELTQDFCMDYVVDCNAGPVNHTFCYFNNIDDDPSVATFTYTSTDGTPLNLTFNSGQMETCCDELVVIDSDGTELYNQNTPDPSGLTFQSSGDTISWYINSDISVSCESSGYEPFDVTVSCATCINPEATYTVVDDCENGDQFLVDVNIVSMGDATSLTISNNIDANTVSVTSTGTYQVGPFPFLTDVIITTSNDQDSNCVINSPTIYELSCPPDNDLPCNAFEIDVNEDDTCTLYTSGTLLSALPSSVSDPSCGGDPDDDVWFVFTSNNENQIISINNIANSTYDNLDFAVYEGTCDNLTEIFCTTEEAASVSGLTVGNTYYIRVYSAYSSELSTTFDVCVRPSVGNVIVDQTTYTVEQLVTEVLIDNPCAQIENITYSTGTDFSDVNGIGYFYRESEGFPFEDGLILTSGDASQASGPNTFVSDGGYSWPGDNYLADITGELSYNATVIEFDFVPFADEISFDFIMASEEYDMGSFECNYSDAFAFLLTDESGNTTNLAVIPNTTTPILVTNIHPDNGVCGAANPEYFGAYTPDNLPPISFDGRTAVFTAQSDVNIGETYHIKLVIADSRDTAYDSGVYLKAGSFDIGEFNLGEDITIESGNAVCDGEPIILSTEASQVEHVWYKDGFVIEGETGHTLEVVEEGTYTAQVIFGPGCTVEDTVVVEFLPKPEVSSTPDDLIACEGVNGFGEFILTDNDAVVLGSQDPSEFTVTYHETPEDADAGSNALSSPYTNLEEGQIIYVRLTNNTTTCYSTSEFQLFVESPLTTSFPQDIDYEVCPNATVPLTITAVPDNYNESDVTINWYLDGVLQEVALSQRVYHQMEMD